MLSIIVIIIIEQSFLYQWLYAFLVSTQMSYLFTKASEDGKMQCVCTYVHGTDVNSYDTFFLQNLNFYK